MFLADKLCQFGKMIIIILSLLIYRKKCRFSTTRFFSLRNSYLIIYGASSRTLISLTNDWHARSIYVVRCLCAQKSDTNAQQQHIWNWKPTFPMDFPQFSLRRPKVDLDIQKNPIKPETNYEKKSFFFSRLDEEVTTTH